MIIQTIAPQVNRASLKAGAKPLRRQPRVPTLRSYNRQRRVHDRLCNEMDYYSDLYVNSRDEIPKLVAEIHKLRWQLIEMEVDGIDTEPGGTKRLAFLTERYEKLQRRYRELTEKLPVYLQWAEDARLDAQQQGRKLREMYCKMDAAEEQEQEQRRLRRLNRAGV